MWTARTGAGKFRRCLPQREDRRFHYHPGVDPLAAARALWQNLSRGKVVSGASTVTMQVVRLARKGKLRARIFWHLDQEYVGVTQDIHQLALAPGPGEHRIVLVDERGERPERSFVMLGGE